MKKSRLKKEAMMPINMFQSQLDQISDKGRDVLKAIEDYKFFVDQASRVMKNDPALTEMIQSKKKNLEQSTQQIYDVVFDIENMDINSIYQRQQQVTNENENGGETEQKPSEEKQPENQQDAETEKESLEDKIQEKPEENKPQEDKGEEDAEKGKAEEDSPPANKPVAKRLKNKLEKTSEYAIGTTEEDVLRKFPTAKKTSEHQYIATKDGMTYYIGWDSLFERWKVFGRTQSEPNVFQKLMDFLVG